MRSKIVFGAVLLMLVFLLVRSPAPGEEETGPRLVFDDGTAVRVEVLTTPEERSHGLMRQHELAPDAGVLFVFEEEGTYYFWMKNTYIPLDIIWFDSDFRVVHVQPRIYPTLEDPPPMYTSPVPALYVLEVNAGFAQKHGIEVGDRASLVQ